MRLIILKSQTADTRTAEVKVSKEQLLKSSVQHIGDVKNAMLWMVEKLSEKASKHDFTKLSDIDGFHRDFKAIQDGSLENFKNMDWFKLHVSSERHHLNDHCPDDVDLFDVLERIADITMAGMGRSGKIFDDTLSAEILTKAYKNTIKLLQDNIEVV